MKIAVSCKNCSKTFFTQEYRFKTGRGKYCSRKCSDEKTLFAKGKKPFNKGIKGWTNSGSYKEKEGELSYTGVHRWVTLRRGKPEYCEMCKRTDR